MKDRQGTSRFTFAHIGTVDCTKDSNKIALNKSASKSGGQHHIIPLDWVEKIDEKCV